MSWSSRRRFIYLLGIGIFFLITIGGPIAYKIFTIPATCSDGIQNQSETDVDRGGPCALLDERFLAPSSVLWARAFQVRDGSYNAVAYIQNPNEEGGVAAAPYLVGLYDAANILIAEKTGTTYIMPGTITPVFISNVDTGNRVVKHTYFKFTAPLVWERMSSVTHTISVNNIETTHLDTVPRVAATAHSTNVTDVQNLQFVAVVFGPDGNAIGVSSTHADRINSYGTYGLVFTWPDPFSFPVGHVDIVPVHEPERLGEKK